MFGKISLILTLLISTQNLSHGQLLPEKPEGFLQLANQEFDDRYHTF
jgi:hypothetical protein